MFGGKRFEQHNLKYKTAGVTATVPVSHKKSELNLQSPNT